MLQFSYEAKRNNLALSVAQNLAAVSLFYKLTAKSGFNGEIRLFTNHKTSLTLRPEAEIHIGDALIEQSEKCHFRGINLPKSTSFAVGRFKHRNAHKLRVSVRPPKRAFF